MNKSIKPGIALVTLILITIASFQISAQSTTVRTLQECIDMAMENNPTMQSGRIMIEKAKDLQGTAFNIERTGVSISQDPTSGGGPENSISLSQAFEFPTIYGARRGLLKAETNLELSNLEVTRNELIRELSTAYYQLLYARENSRILQKQDSLYSKFLYLANAKLESGETGRLEQMNAQRLYDENRIELQKADKNYQNIQLLLQKWINSDEYIDPTEAILPILDSDLSVGQFDPKQTPQNNVFSNKMEVSQKNLNVIKQGYLPGINFSLKNQLLIKGFNPYNIDRERFEKGNFMGFEVGVSIPLFFGEQRAKTKAAKRDIELTKMQQYEVELAMSKEYKTSLNEFSKAKNTLDYYLQRGNNQAAEMARISQIAYQQGEINYIEYIQNLKAAVEINLQYAVAVNEYNQAIIQLNYLQGYK